MVFLCLKSQLSQHKLLMDHHETTGWFYLSCMSGSTRAQWLFKISLRRGKYHCINFFFWLKYTLEALMKPIRLYPVSSTFCKLLSPARKTSTRPGKTLMCVCECMCSSLPHWVQHILTDRRIGVCVGDCVNMFVQACIDLPGKYSAQFCF